MLKKLLQVMLLTVLMVPLGARAQSLTVANGTETNEYVPVYGYYTDAAQHNQVLYVDSLLSDMEGNYITAVSYYLSQAATSAWGTSVVVKMGIVTDSVITNLLPTDSLTQVWAGTVNGTDATWTFVLDSAFHYVDGNLLIDITTTAATYSRAYFAGISTATTPSIYQYTSWGSTYGSAQNFLPKTTFNYNATGSVCNAPTVPVLVSNTVTSLTFQWTAGGSETAWDIMVGDSLISNYSSTSITVNDLTPSTRYNVSVRAICGGDDVSVWTTPVPMITVCAAIATLPWSTGFEGELDGEVPLCWTRTVPFIYTDYDGDTNYGPYAYNYNYYSHTGSTMLYFYAYSDYSLISNHAVIASPYIAHNPADLHVTFWVSGYYMNEGDTLWAGIMTDPTDESSFIPVTAITAEELGYAAYSTDYTQFEFYTGSLDSLGFAEGDSACIAFRSVIGDDNYSMTILIDDVEVDAMGDCLAPTLNSGSIDSISYEGVQLSWECSDEPEDGFVVRLLNTQNQTLTYYASQEDSLLIENGLSPNTTYQAWVATICGEDTTGYTAIGTFTTHYRCYAVVEPTVAALTANAAALTWDFTGTGIEPTDVEVVLMDLTDSSTTTLHVTDDNCIFSGLTTGHMYQATFVTYCGDSDTSWSVSVNFMPHVPACAEFAGTNSSSYVPFYSYYNNGFSEMLYDGTEFAGFDTVNGLSFQVANTLNRNNIVDIWMAYVPDSITGLTGATYIPVDSMIHVVSDYSFSTATSGWIDMIPFDTLFPTQATGNVIIAVWNHTGSYSSGLTWATHTSTVGNSVYRYTDDYIDPSDPFSSGDHTTSDAANIQVYGNCSGGDCEAPGARVASVDTHSVTLTWLPGGSESSWNVLYREASATNWTNYGAAATVPLTITGLNAGTEYQFRVGSDCGDTIVYGNAITGTTLCGPVHAPFTIVPNGENNCWTFNGSYYYSSYSNYTYIYSGATIMTPVIVDSINTLQLRLSVYSSPYYVGVCDANGQNITWMDTVDPGDSYDFHYIKSYLNNYTGNGTNIIIKASAGYNYTYINQIIVEPLDDCMPVTDLEIDSVTTTDAWLSWTSDGNNFLVKYMDEADTTNTWLSATSNTTSIHLTGMNPNTRYQVKVFNVCSDSSQSDSVTTRLIMGCVTYTTPFFEGFGHDELPVCWNTATAGATYYTFEETARYGYDYVYTQAEFSGLGTDWLMTPPIQIPANADFIKLVYLVGGGAYPYEGYPDSYGSYDVFVSTTGYGDTTTYTTLLLNDTVHSRTSSGVTVDYARIPLAAYAGQTVSFGFRARCNQYGNVYFSDIQVREAAEPMYYVYGNTEAFTNDTTTFRAEYQEGDTAGMTLAWYSRMVAAGEATVVPTANDEFHIVYTAAGVDSLSFTATNSHGADTIIWSVSVFDCPGINEFPYHQGFEENDACWQKVYADNDPSINTMMLVDSNNLSYNLDSVYEGTYCFRFSSYSRTTVYDQYLISPLLHGTNRTLNFHYAMYGSSDYLWVGYSTTNRDTASFIWTPVTNSTAWAEYTDSIADNVKYIAFRYYGNYTYYVYLDALNITGTASQLTCDAPVNVLASADETTATVNFISEVGNYEVAIAEQWDEATVTPVAITDTFYTFSGLTAATEYTIGVRSICNASLASDWVTVTVITDEHPCATPSALTVSDVTLTSATLGWTIGEAETQWELHVTGTNYDETFTVTTNPYTLTGLTPAVTYSFTVSAICSETQTSDPSEAQTFTTESCQPVSGVNVSDITTTTATVTWTAPAGVTSFEVEYGASGFNQGAGTTVQANTNSASLTGLTSNMAYDVYVRSVCAEGIYSAWSTVNTFTTNEGEGIDDVNSAAIALYPNPATTTVTISGIEGQATVTIVDMNGREVHTQAIKQSSNQTITLDLTGYAQGAYFVRIVGEQQNAIRKLIVK